MKQVQILIIALFMSTFVMAQIPPAFNYQAVARNNAGVALSNQAIQVRLSIFRGPTSLYSETRSVTTNLQGLFNVQISSAGATSTTGNFGTIYWLNNTPWISLKVEWDISNTNVFTDMGSQPLAAVPYALAAGTAIDAINLGGRYVDPVPVPTSGDVLRWNGLAWVPYTIPVAPPIATIAGSIAAIPFGGGAADWVFAGPSATISVLSGDRINGTATGVFGHNNNNPQPVSFSVCYSDVAAGSPLTAFYGADYPDGHVLAQPNKTNLTAAASFVPSNVPVGGVSLKVGFCIKNKSSTVTFGSNDFVNGFFQVVKP